jgi:hypothetical protein
MTLFIPINQEENCEMCLPLAQVFLTEMQLFIYYD